VYSVKVVESGQQLLELVTCPSLELDFTDYMEQWVTASSQVDDELKRFYLLTFLSYFFCVLDHCRYQCSTLP